MEKIANDPPASGLLVTMVVEEMPARAAGIKPGDILVKYGTRRTVDRAALHDAIVAHEQDDAVPVEIVRSGKKRELKVRAGRLGVQGVPVEKGVAIETRPPAKKVTFDYSLLEPGPIDFWMDFALDKRKAGFEHHVYQKRGSTLVLDYEVAFDGGEAWGLNHFVVNVQMSIDGARPEPHAVRFENPLAGWVTEGKLSTEGRKRIWTSSIRGGREKNRVIVPPEVIPSYAVSTLPLFMKPEPDACLHYTPLTEGLGVTATPAGLLCAGEDTLTVSRRKVATWRWESHAFGEREGTTWVDAKDGLPVKIDYAGPSATRSTRAKALEGLPDGLVPRSS